MTPQAVTVEELDPLCILDFVADKLALPKIGPLLDIFAPKTVLRSLGIRTLDQIGNEALSRIKSEVRVGRLTRIGRLF